VIIVEDGSIVVGANSYVSRADYIAYAASLGVTVPDDETADLELIKSAIFIGAQECLKGKPTSKEQSTAFPRTGVVIDGWKWGDHEIPRQVILCQMQLAMDVRAGIDLWNPPKAQPVKKSTRIEGAVSVTYAVSDVDPSKLSRMSTARALLNSLVCSGAFLSVPMVRV